MDVRGGSHAESVIGVSFFGGLRAETTRFGGGDRIVFGPILTTNTSGSCKLHSYIRHLQAYKPTRTSGTKMIQTYKGYRTYKPISIEQRASQPGGPVGAGGFFEHDLTLRQKCIVFV